MTSSDSAVTAWPALSGGTFPARITYERGIWGKLNGVRADYKWIATTPAFAAGNARLEKELQLGTEDVPQKATHWRSLGEQSFAVVCYPSRSVDASGRSSFLEKQVFSWRRPAGAPAAFGALALLPKVEKTDAAIWWNRRTQSWSEDDDSTLILTPEEHAPFSVTLQELSSTAAAGLAELSRIASEESLTGLYAHLLAGHRAVPLAGLPSPLSPEALAALLLPLPRALADSLSVAGWLPSQRVPDPTELRRCWDVVLGGSALPPPPSEEPPRELWEKARALARAVLARDPAMISPRPVRPSAVPGRRHLRLALWGPSSAGKTALLAQLYLGDQDGDQEWESSPAGASQEFFDHMRSRMRSENLFPKVTVAPETIEYIFRHRRTRVEVLLRLEDQAGSESEQLTDPVRRRLAEADGLLLLFDPHAQGTTLHSQIWRTLEHLNPELSGERAPIDDRPIAVCLSKADLLIRTVDDFQSARTDPDGFVRRYDRMDLAKLLDRSRDQYKFKYKFFPVSAAGLRVEYGVVESVVFYDEALRPRLAPGGVPLHVMSPFTWLLDQVAARHER